MFKGVVVLFVVSLASGCTDAAQVSETTISTEPSVPSAASAAVITTAPPTGSTTESSGLSDTTPSTNGDTSLSDTTPIEDAVTARLADFNAAADRCISGPSDCDVVALSDEFGDGPDGSLGLYMSSVVEEWASAGNRVENVDAIERTVRDLAVESDTTVTVLECYRNAAVLVDSGDSVVDDAVGYGERVMGWTLRNSRWIITNFIDVPFDAYSSRVDKCGLQD